MSLFSKKYNDLPILAKWKALILDYGLNVSPGTLKAIPNIENFKVKYRIKKPTVKDFKFIDTSSDESLIPAELIMSYGDKRSLVKVSYREHSPLKLKIDNGKLSILEKGAGKIPIGIDLVAKRKYTSIKLPKEIISSQPFLEDFVQVVGVDRIGILAYEGCWHWISKHPCLFCDANPKRSNCKSELPTLNTLTNFNFDAEKWWENYGPKFLKALEYSFRYLLATEKIEPHQHLQLMAGNMPNIENVWKICQDISGVLNKVRPLNKFDSYFNIAAPKKNHKKFLRSAKEEMGFNQIAFNLEVIGENRFKEVCPGKAVSAGYQNTVDTLKKATDVFGFGKVRSNFVLGAQPVEELISGIEELADNGIVADYSVFVPKRGTAWENKASPSMDTIVSFTKQLAEIYKQHKFQSIYCGLSSRSNMLYEILDE